MLCQIGEKADDSRIKLKTQSIVHRPQFQVLERVVQIGNAASIELIAKPVPRLGRG